MTARQPAIVNKDKAVRGGEALMFRMAITSVLPITFSAIQLRTRINMTIGAYSIIIINEIKTASISNL